MLCGIYLLKFNGTNKVYVGQSVNIDNRILRHKNNLEHNVASKKLQEAYLCYGIFTYDILCECEEQELDILEKEAIDLYDSYYNGLNSRNGSTVGNGLKGDQNPGSKFSNEQVIDVFKLLVSDKDLTYKEIANTTNTNISLVKSIKIGVRHTWLKEEFPDTYPILASLDKVANKNSAKNKGITYPPIYDKTGNMFLVSNVSSFAREHNLHAGHLNEVLNRKSKTTKGWHL